MQTPLTEIDPHTAAANSLERFQAAFDRGDARAAAAYFLPGGHWRDLVAFGSHILTMNGTAEITQNPHSALRCDGLGRRRLPIRIPARRRRTGRA